MSSAESIPQSVSDRALGVRLFNETWDLIDLPDRTEDETALMIHKAHASIYHWLQSPDCKSRNAAIGEWLLARVYSILRMGEPALFHARRCLNICEAGKVEDWVTASAHEGLARAAAAAGDAALFATHFDEAQRLVSAIADPDERAQIESDLAAEPWFGMRR
jgi:hypothetical protein